MPTAEEVQYIQDHEDDGLEEVLVALPSLSNFMANLHPLGSLLESHVNLSQATRTLEKLIAKLKERGVKVHVVRDVLSAVADMGVRLELEDLAAQSLTYFLDKTSDASLITPVEGP
jgi:arginine deiminase